MANSRRNFLRNTALGAAMATVGTTVPALAELSTIPTTLDAFDPKAILGRVEFAIDVLRDRYICKGWNESFDHAAATRVLNYFKPNAGTGALLGNPVNPSGIIDDVAAAVNFDFSGLNGPNDIDVVRDTLNAYADVFTLGNFGTDNGFFSNGNESLFQQLEIGSNNPDTINFGSGAYGITTNADNIGASSHNYVQTTANGAGLADLNTGAQWAIINNVHGGGNSDTLTFKADNVQTFANLGDLGGSASAISGIAAGIGEALNTSAHTVVEFTFKGNTFIFDHADNSFALTAADAMVEITGIHPIAAVSAAYEITFATWPSLAV